MADEVISGGQQIASEATLQRLLDSVAGSGDSSAALKIKELGEKSKVAGKELEQFKDWIGKTIEASSALTKSFISGTATTSQMAGVLGTLPGPIGLVFQGLSKLAGFQEQAMTQYQVMSKAGISFGGSLTEMRKAAADTHMTLEQFASFMKNNAADMIRLGGSANEGAKAFRLLSNELLTSPAGANLQALGYTTEEVNQGMINYIAMTGGRTKEELKNSKEVTAGAQNYLEQMDRLADITGKTRDELQKELKQKQEVADIELYKASLSKEDREKFSAVYNDALAKYGQGAADNVLAQAQGRAVTTEAGKKYAALAPQAANALKDQYNMTMQYGAKSAQARQAEDNARLSNRDAFQRFSGTLASSTDLLKGNESAAIRAAKDTAAGMTTQKALTDAEKSRDAAKAEQVESEAKSMAIANQNLKEFSSVILSFISPFISALTPLISGLSYLTPIIGTVAAVLVAVKVAGMAVAAWEWQKLAVAKAKAAFQGGGAKGVASMLLGAKGGAAPTVPTPPATGPLAAAKGGGGGFIDFIKSLGRGLASLAPIAVPMLIGAAAVSGVIALLGLGIAAAIALIGLSLPVFAKGLKDIAEIDGMNLLKVAAGITALGFAMVAFTAGSVVGGLGAIGAKVLNFFSGGGPIGLIKDSVNELSPILPQLLALGPALQTFSTSLNAGFSGIDTAKLQELASGISSLGSSLVAFSGATVAAGLAGAGSQIISFFTGGGPIAQIKTTVAELSPLIPSMQALGPALSNYSSAIVSFGKAVSGVDIAKAEKLKEAMKGPGLAESISSAAGKMVSATANLVSGQQGSGEKTSLALTTLNNTINDLKVIMREVAENTKNNVNATKKLNGNLFA
jgi:hypothetical protein